MMRKLPLILGVAVVALLASSCQKLKSRDQLNKGVQAFKNAQYAEAVESFKTAVELDPDFPTARLYLGTAYMQQYIPGAESPENTRMATAARDEFMKVLEKDPNEKTAIASLASLYLNQKNWDEAEKLQEVRGCGPEQSGAVVQPGLHCLVEVVSGLWDHAQQYRDEAGESGANQGQEAPRRIERQVRPRDRGRSPGAR